MQGACVSVLCVCICVSALLRSAISQPPKESDTYTVRMDESFSLLLLSSLTPFFLFASFLLSLSHSLYIYMTRLGWCYCFSCVWKSWPRPSLFFNIPQPFPPPRQHFIAVIAGGNFSFNSMFLQALRFSFHAAHSCSIFSAIIMTLFPNSGLRFGVFEVTFGSRRAAKNVTNPL